MKSLTKFGFTMLIFLVLTITFSSCYKKKDTIAVITVVDSNDTPVAGAEVVLDWYEVDSLGSQPRENLVQTASTDGAGKASFNYNEMYKSGMAGVFVLDIIVNGETLGVIKVEQETTSEETVIIL